MPGLFTKICVGNPLRAKIKETWQYATSNHVCSRKPSTFVLIFACEQVDACFGPRFPSLIENSRLRF